MGVFILVGGKSSDLIPLIHCDGPLLTGEEVRSLVRRRSKCHGYLSNFVMPLMTDTKWGVPPAALRQSIPKAKVFLHASCQDQRQSEYGRKATSSVSVVCSSPSASKSFRPNGIPWLPMQDT